MSRFFLPICAALALAACQAQTPEPAAPEPQATAETEAERANDGAVVAGYACEGGNIVELVREGRVARLSLSDGRTIRLGEMSGSQPQTWSDVGLRFTIGDGFTELSQTNGDYTLTCEQQ